MTGAAAGVHLGEPAALPVRGCIRSPPGTPVDRGVAGHRRGVDGTATADAIGQRDDRVVVGIWAGLPPGSPPPPIWGHPPANATLEVAGRPGGKMITLRPWVVDEVGRAPVRLRGRHVKAAVFQAKPGYPYSMRGTLPVLVSLRMIPSWRGEAGTSRGRPA